MRSPMQSTTSRATVVRPKPDAETERNARILAIDAERDELTERVRGLRSEQRRLMIDKHVDRLWALIPRNSTASPVPAGTCQQLFTAFRRARITPLDSNLPTEIEEWNTAIDAAEGHLLTALSGLADYYTRRLRR